VLKSVVSDTETATSSIRLILTGISRTLTTLHHTRRSARGSTKSQGTPLRRGHDRTRGFSLIRSESRTAVSTDIDLASCSRCHSTSCRDSHCEAATTITTTTTRVCSSRKRSGDENTPSETRIARTRVVLFGSRGARVRAAVIAA